MVHETARQQGSSAAIEIVKEARKLTIEDIHDGSDVRALSIDSASFLSPLEFQYAARGPFIAGWVRRGLGTA
jgi:hypothetical protein